MNNPQRSSKRKRHRRSSISSSSSVPSSSSGGNDDPRYSNNRGKKGSTAKTISNANKSIFSGFWSDAELEDGDKENDKGGNNNNNNNNANKGAVDYEGFNLTIGDTIYEIGVGDVVAMRNTSAEENVSEQQGRQGKGSDSDKQEDNADDDNGDEENSRERRQRRRLDRERNETSVSIEEPATATSATEAVTSSSSDYAVDAQAEKASVFYTETDTTTDIKMDTDNNDNDDKNVVDGDGNAGNGDGNSEAEKSEAAAKVVAAVDNDNTKESIAEPSQQPSPPSPRTTETLTMQPPKLVKEAKVGDGLMLARVERIWQEKGRGGRTGKVLFKARWFLKKEDVDSLPLGEITGPVSSEDFANRITEHDLVLSNQSDDNHVTTICDLIQVLYRHPDLDAEMPSLILPTTYLCRYSLRIDDDPKVVVLPYTGENDDWGEMTVAALSCRKRSVENSDGSDELGGSNRSGDGGHLLHALGIPKQGRRGGDSGSSSDGFSESETNYGGDNKKRRRVGDFADEGIDEGTTEQRDIQVGRDHQVYVPPFVRNQKIVSRNPIRMWKPDKISQEGTDDYIEQASKILTPFLREHHLTQEEPYAPFPTERMEELSKSLSWNRLPTLSSVSTVSSLTTHRVDALREFNIDALLRNLHVSNYNIKAAIAAIEASPRDYLIAWSPHEKTRFNTGFRRYSGSLRAIHKGMGNKALQEVIDYHYRFKIPDQFRRFQERKREQAVRMLECIETKRNLNAPIIISNSIVGSQNGGADEKKVGADWTKTGNSTVAVSVEERRVKAKELLLDVEAKLGRGKMMKVFEVFKTADESALVQSKTKLLEIFRGHQEFQSRFLEFLPQQLRL